jgi:hypothetical protein
MSAAVSSTMLVTPDGRWVSSGTADFVAALGDATPDQEPVAFAVNELGFIRFQIIQQLIIEVELNPGKVKLAALLAVQQKISSSAVNLFRIKYFDASWKSEICSSPEFAISRLSVLCASWLVPATHGRFLVEPQDFLLLFEDDPNPMRPMAQKWRVSFGNFDPGIMALVMRNELLPWLAIVGVKPHQPDPVWRFVGDGYRWLGNGRLFRTLVGEKVANVPDRDYGEWASSFYRLVAGSGQPRYDLVTASIQYQNEDVQPRRPIRYERLLLPWKTSANEVLVTICSKIVDGAETAPRLEAAGSGRPMARTVVNAPSVASNVPGGL